MDQATLVKAGHNLIDFLEAEGFSPRGAMWINNKDAQTWRLWIVPPKGFTDKNEFYRLVSTVVSKHRNELFDIDASDTEFVLDTHPAIKPMGVMFRVENRGSIFISDNMVNGFYIPDGIILKLTI